jgi:hypothetical protein
MSKPQISDFEVMQHADGEVDERSAPDVRGHIERSSDAQTKVESLGQMTELVRGHLELAADAIPERRFDQMWRAVERGIDADAPVGLWARVTAWFDRHRGHMITGVVSAGAVAAVALVLRPGDPDPVTATQSGAIDVQPAALRQPPVIDDLETPGGNSTVLNIQDEDGHMTVIVVTPEDTVEGI